MIARIWHGRVARRNAEAYRAFLDRTGLADYRATPGNEGVVVLRRDDGDVTHFTLVTFWRDVEAIKAFAGEDYERARYYGGEDDAMLLEHEEFVVHHEVLSMALPSAV